MKREGRFERTSRKIVKRRFLKIFGFQFFSPDFQLFQINFWHFSAVAARHGRRQRRLAGRRSDDDRIDFDDFRFVDADRDRRNVGVGTRRSRNLDLRRERRRFDAATTVTRSCSAVETSRKLSDIRDDVSRVTSQVRRHLRRRRSRRRQSTRTSGRITLGLANIGVLAEMIGVFESVRVESRRDVRALLFLKNETPRSFPGERDEVNVFFGVERSSLTLRRAPFAARAAPGCSGTSGRIRFFNESEILRPVFLVSARFVQGHRDHVERRAGLRDLQIIEFCWNHLFVTFTSYKCGTNPLP